MPGSTGPPSLNHLQLRRRPGLPKFVMKCAIQAKTWAALATWAFVPLLGPQTGAPGGGGVGGVRTPGVRQVSDFRHRPLTYGSAPPGRCYELSLPVSPAPGKMVYYAE